MRRRVFRALALLLPLLPVGLRAAEPDALLVVVGDQHSAYERTAQFVAHIDRLHAAHPGVPLAVLIDGDSLEYGNVIARRSAGAIDFAMFAALAKRAPTILNLGNHEPEFYAVDDTVARLRATGVMVVSNLVNRTTHEPFAPAFTRLRLGTREAVVVGLATDHLNTYRVAVRPTLDATDPVAWAQKNLLALLATAPLAIVLTHTGVAADRAILPLVPDGTLFAGAHDHLRFVYPIGRTVYFHSGSWNECFSLASLTHDPNGRPQWDVKQIPLNATDPADPELAALIREVSAKHLTAEDNLILGRLPDALSPPAAARFAAAAVRAGAGVDAAIIGNTTFGAGLPAGEITRVAFDAWVRFDGTICIAEVSGAQLAAILATANQGPDTPFSERHGEYLVAASPAAVDPARTYRIATTDYVMHNATRYSLPATIVFQEKPELHLKALVAAALVSATPAKR